MKTKPHRKQRDAQRPSKRASKHARGFKAQIIDLIRPSPIELSGGVDDEEALVTAESLDERGKRG
jgi:hypothetical protein